QPVLSKVSQLHTGRKRIAHQIICDAGEESLATMRHRAKASTAVDGGTVVIALAQISFPGVQGGAHANWSRYGPGFGVKSLLQSGSGCHGIGGPREDREPAVTFSAWAHEHTVVAAYEAFNDLVVPAHGCSRL